MITHRRIINLFVLFPFTNQLDLLTPSTSKFIMEKYKQNILHPRSTTSRPSSRPDTSPPASRSQPISCLNPTDLNFIKAKNHAIKGRLIDDPSTVEQICNILSSTDQMNLQPGVKCFQVSTFTSMQRRQSQKLLVWLKSKLSELQKTEDISMEEFMQYRQSIVNIVLAFVMEKVGTICKQLAETLGYLWSQTFSMFQRIIGCSVKKQIEKDKLIANQQMQIEKQEVMFVQKTTKVQEQQAQSLMTLKQNFKDCIISNREQYKEILRLNEDLKGEQLKLLNLQQALIRSVDINIHTSCGENLKWARMVLNSLFKSRSSKSKLQKSSRMLKYKEYAQFKVQQTLAKHMKTLKKYELFSIDEIIHKFLRVPSVDLGQIGMSGLFLTRPTQSEDNKLSYDFTVEDICMKPLRAIFSACKCMVAETQTQHCREFVDQCIQTFNMTNLASKGVQTVRVSSTQVYIQTEELEGMKLQIARKQNTHHPKEEQEQARLKLIPHRKSVFALKSFFRNQNMSHKPSHTQSASRNSIQNSEFSQRNDLSYRKQSQRGEDAADSLKNRPSSQQTGSLTQNQGSQSTSKLKQTINKIIEVCKVVKPLRKSAINTIFKSKHSSRIIKNDSLTPQISRTQIYNGFAEGRPSDLGISKGASRKVSNLKEDRISVRFADSRAIFETRQFTNSSQKLLGKEVIGVQRRSQRVSNKTSKQISLQGLNLSMYEIKNLVYTYEVKNNSMLWGVAHREAKSEPAPIKNVSHKVHYLVRLFNTLFSYVVKNRIFSNDFISPQSSKKYSSSNLHPKYVFQPLQPLSQILIQKLLCESKKKQQIEKSLRLIINQLLVLSQTKEMELFTGLMGLNNQMMGSTELEILVRLMYFFNQSKPYRFSTDLKVDFNTLQKYISVIVDNLFDKKAVEQIIAQFNQEQPIPIVQVFKKVCRQIKILKAESFHSYKYISRLFEFASLDDLVLLLKCGGRRELIPSVCRKFGRYSDCLNKNHQRCLSQEKLWRLGLECELPTEQSFSHFLLQVKIPSTIMAKNVVGYYHRMVQGSNKKQSSLKKIVILLQKSDSPDRQFLTSILFRGLVEQMTTQFIGMEVLVMSEMFTQL